MEIPILVSMVKWHLYIEQLILNQPHTQTWVICHHFRCKASQYNGHLFRYRGSHYEDKMKVKMVMRLSYLYNENFYTGKSASLYWDSQPQGHQPISNHSRWTFSNLSGSQYSDHPHPAMHCHLKSHYDAGNPWPKHLTWNICNHSRHKQSATTSKS